jgi:hypothetical protein
MPRTRNIHDTGIIDRTPADRETEDAKAGEEAAVQDMRSAADYTGPGAAGAASLHTERAAELRKETEWEEEEEGTLGHMKVAMAAVDSTAAEEVVRTIAAEGVVRTTAAEEATHTTVAYERAEALVAPMGRRYRTYPSSRRDLGVLMGVATLPSMWAAKAAAAAVEGRKRVWARRIAQVVVVAVRTSIGPA